MGPAVTQGSWGGHTQVLVVTPNFWWSRLSSGGHLCLLLKMRFVRPQSWLNDNRKITGKLLGNEPGVFKPTDGRQD